MSEPIEWTAKELAMLRKLSEAGYPDVVIGRRLGKTPGAVAARARLLGLTSARVDPAAHCAPLKMKPVPRGNNAVPLLAATAQHCRAVCDERGADGFALFCGEVVKARSYCNSHYALFYQPTET